MARDIARVLGANEKQDGYLSGNGYLVTWAFGHLVGLAMPEAYGIQSFRRESLPIIPDSFQLTPRQVKAEKGYKADPGALKQLKVIKEVFDHSDKIIVATDAGREGELIFRYIYQYIGCNKPFVRLWISSLTDKSIREGLQNLKAGSLYDNLFLLAQARSEADYLIGINSTQALSVAAGQGIFSLGRVQSPTLAMICTRFLENKNFVPQKYWQLKLQAAKDNVSFAALSADKTLSIAQKLYEGKLISYPRTGSRYISQDVFEEIPERLVNLEQYTRFGGYAAGMKGKALNSRSVNDGKVTDHYALIVTENLPGKLETDEQAIYELIAGRMLEAFSEKCVKDVTSVTLECAGSLFTVKGSVIKSAGWRAVFGEKEDGEDNATLPAMQDGDSLPLSGIELLEKQTKPKPLHTESSLLSSMETAGKELENADLKASMKDTGIGTPATRAAIIETLFSRQYIVREKKNLVPTEKGLAVYNIIRDKKIADVEMTGMWENTLAKIESGEMNPDTFRKGIEVYARQITAELLDVQLSFASGSGCICPKCKTGRILFYPKVAKCSNVNCSVTIFRNKSDKQLTDKQITELVTTGKTGLIKGFKSKNGKVFDASLAFDEQFNVTFVFPEKKGKPKK